jgi:hypothetical protein
LDAGSDSELRLEVRGQKADTGECRERKQFAHE